MVLNDPPTLEPRTFPWFKTQTEDDENRTFTAQVTIRNTCSNYVLIRPARCQAGGGRRRSLKIPDRLDTLQVFKHKKNRWDIDRCDTEIWSSEINKAHGARRRHGDAMETKTTELHVVSIARCDSFTVSLELLDLIQTQICGDTSSSVCKTQRCRLSDPLNTFYRRTVDVTWLIKTGALR